jgi:pimeloyl-ACP methyl ester carboxylesterase
MLRWHSNRLPCLLLGMACLSSLVETCSADDQLPPEGKLVSINGMEMYYEIHGQGEPLVLLHGFSGSSSLWKPQVPDLAKHYQLVISDLRGHGRSTNPSGKFTHRQSALDVFALLDTLKIQRFRAMGISTGGMTLIHMATSQPERIEAMVLIGATHYFPEQARAFQRAASPDKLTEKEWAFYRALHKHGDDQIRALLQQFHDVSTSYDDMNFTPPLLSTIQARTLILHGDRDAHFPVEIPVELYRSIPKSYLWIVPNGGHVPEMEDSPMNYVQVLLQFLTGEWEKNNAPR